MAHRLRTRRVAILLFEGVQSIDVTGPLEVFTGADRLLRDSRRGEAPVGGGAVQVGGARDGGYEVCTLSADGKPLRTSSGLTIVPDGCLREVPRGLDTLIVPGGDGTREAIGERRLLRWIAETSTRARRTASVCTGAFLLAAAGLLDGRRATTHWASAESLARRYPKVRVDPDPIFVRDGELWSSAGVSAGMDLTLALVEDDHDRELALTVARHLVLFLRRPGTQSQFSATLASQQPEREPLREVQRLILEELASDHSVEAMAARAHMSPRHFARAFRAETGVTPARYVEHVRLEAARRVLEDSSTPIAEVARECGFGTAETMRRVFLRGLAVGPAEYRRRFHVRSAA
ncbi:MAG TPA: DJ-1/PfpI family protein [Solirubrobacteraceae bacterium]|jgi:transcriptional regulator GlxA family with amidase domain|nr:DJ-1/PfpI family protein [Solirubrobacteraceae bacterium]